MGLMYQPLKLKQALQKGQEHAEYFNGILPINTLVYTTSRSRVAHNVRVKSGITPQPPHRSGRERFAHPVPRYLMFRMPPCIK